MKISAEESIALSARFKAAFNAFVQSRCLKWELARIQVYPDPVKETVKVEIEIDEPDEYKAGE